MHKVIQWVTGKARIQVKNGETLNSENINQSLSNDSDVMSFEIIYQLYDWNKKECEVKKLYHQIMPHMTIKWIWKPISYKEWKVIRENCYAIRQNG